MSVWILHWEYPYEGDSCRTVFATRDLAEKQACHDLLERMSTHWDLTDTDSYEAAIKINDYVSVGDYSVAIREYNEFMSDLDTADYYSIEESDVMASAEQPILLLLNPPLDDEEEDEDEDIHPWDNGAEASYQASSPGATCRGPCHQFNPDAYADQSDGTHLCYQCKWMTQIFGN